MTLTSQGGTTIGKYKYLGASMGMRKSPCDIFKFQRNSKVSFSKAFNRIDHNIIVTILGDLNIPTCALRLVISYLSGRNMCVRYNCAESAEQHIPGGGPQGGLLTVILFDLQVNLAGAPCPIYPTIPIGTAGPEPDPVQLGPLPLCHATPKTMKKKYVDDLTLLETVDLKSALPSDRTT